MKIRREWISELKRLYEYINRGWRRIEELELGRSSEWTQCIEGSLKLGRFGSWRDHIMRRVFSRKKKYQAIEIGYMPNYFLACGHTKTIA